MTNFKSGMLKREFKIHFRHYKSFCLKEIKKKFEYQRNLLNDMHQNLIRTKLYQSATECKVSSISAH